MKNTLETRLGLFVALAVLAAVLILETLGGMRLFQKHLDVGALFDNVQDLRKGDRVKMAGVEIGTVTDMSFTNNQVKVIMRLNKEADVKTDSVATIKFTGLLGENYVALSFGKPESPPVRPGAILNTEEHPDFGQVIANLNATMGNVKNMTDSFGDKLETLIGPIISFMNNQRDSLGVTITNMQTISTRVAEGQGTIGMLINDKTLYTSALGTVTNLQDSLSDIRLTVAEARKAVDQVNSGEGTIGKLLHDPTLYNETTTGMTNMKEILQKVNQGQGSVGKLVNEPEFYKNVKMTLQKLDKATEGLEDQGPLSVLGIAVNSLF